MPADDPSSDVLLVVEHALVEHFGEVPARASTSFLGVESIDILRFANTGAVTLLTIGMSRRPMGEGGPRAELMVRLSGEPAGDGDLWRRLAVLAAAPVVEEVVYRPGLTIDLGAPLDATSLCTGGLIVASNLPDIVTEQGDVSILQFVPATPNELAYGRARGADALRERWAAAGTDLTDLRRRGVPG